MVSALRCRSVLLVTAPSCFFTVLSLQAVPQSPSSAQELDRSARAILARECLSCHGEARVSGLDMRQLDAILKGGQKGPAVVPGNAEGSLLYQAASHQGALKMPPGSKAPLPPSDLKVLRDWINRSEERRV